MNFLDKAIALVNPKAAFRREQFRVATDILKGRKYEAAAKGRRTASWAWTDGSANTETAQALGILRARARDLGRNNPYAKKAIQVIVSNTVGTGIVPGVQSKSKGRVTMARELWRKWAETTECDFDGQHNFYGLQRLAMRTVAESGEVLILRRRKTGGTLPIQLQVLEPDFLDSSRDIKSLSNGGWITQGVEYNKAGKRVGYWLYKSHPGEGFAHDSKMVPADEVLHIYDVQRAGQVRGVPFGVSAMLRLKDFDEYEDAELVRQKISACLGIFVEDADPANPGTDAGDELLERVEPGMIQHLPPGKRMTFVSPPTTQNYDNYSRKILQAVAAGYGITYEAMTGDLNNVNFSSGRMGWLEMHRQLSDWQYNMLIPMLCERVWNWFLDASVIATPLTAGDLTVTWTPPRREMIDPLKETNAINLQIRNALRTWPEAVREQGYDPEEVLREMKEWNEKFDEAGVILDCDPRKSQGTQLKAIPEQNTENPQNQ